MLDGSLQVLSFEASSIFGDRRFLLGLILQILLVAALVPVLIDYSEKVSSGGDVLKARARGFSPIAIWGRENSTIETGLRRMDRVRVVRVATRERALRGLKSGEFCLVLGIPASADGNLTVLVNREDPRHVPAESTLRLIVEAYGDAERRALVEDALRARIEASKADPERVAKELKSLSAIYLEPLNLSVVDVREAAGGRTSAVKPAGQEGQGSSSAPSDRSGPPRTSFLSLIFLSFGLCFPLLSGSGMMIESVTTEKEDRTVEGLLGTGISRQAILVGKYSSAYLLSAAQAVLLLVVLAMIMRVENVPGVAGWLLLSGAAILSAAGIVSVISKDTKEANLAVTILYVFIFIIFFGPLMIPGPLAWISPFTPMVRLASGSPVDPVSSLGPFLGCILFSLTGVFLSVRLFGSDDFVFGPRPSLHRLLADTVGGRVTNLRGMILLSVGMGALATIPAMILPGVFLLPSLALLGRGGLIPGLIFAAFVEEYFKPYGVYLLTSHHRPRIALSLGALAGLSFSAVENLLFTWALLGTGALQGSLLLFRYVLAPLMHMGLTSMVVAGYLRGRGPRVAALLLASTIHAAYNMAALIRVI